MGPRRTQNEPNDRATGDPEDAFEDTSNEWKKGWLTQEEAGRIPGMSEEGVRFSHRSPFYKM